MLEPDVRLKKCYLQTFLEECKYEIKNITKTQATPK